MISPIELSEEERTLWERIDFNPPLVGGNDNSVRDSIEPGYKLTLSLIDRKAIPAMRWNYFSDPELNIGSSKSRKQIFEQNGTRGEDIFKHPNFHQYIRYFVLGPDLPDATMTTFSDAISHCEPVTSRDQIAFCDLAKREVRNRNLERRHAAEEFFKLSLELGLDVYMSRSVRDAVMKMKIG